MQSILQLNLGGIQIELQPTSPECCYSPGERFSQFIQPGEAHVHLNIHCGAMITPEEAEQRFDSGVTWGLYGAPGRRSIQIRNTEGVLHQYGQFSEDFRQGDIYIVPSTRLPGEYVFPLYRPLGEVYMVNLLGQGNGALLHAYGCVVDGRALVFAGRGGAGKTTTARLWQARPGVQALSDDRVIVRTWQEQLWAFGTPWPGEGGHFSAHSAPLGGLYLLRQASENRLTRLRPIEVVARLMTASFIPLWDAAGMEFTLALFSQLAEQVPCYELSFTPDASAVDYVLAHL